MNKTYRILEILWLVFGVICLSLAAYTIYAKGFNDLESKMLLGGSGMAAFLYVIRRKQRITQENEQQKSDNKG